MDICFIHDGNRSMISLQYWQSQAGVDLTCYHVPTGMHLQIQGLAIWGHVEGNGIPILFILLEICHGNPWISLGTIEKHKWWVFHVYVDLLQGMHVKVWSLL